MTDSLEVRWPSAIQYGSLVRLAETVAPAGDDAALKAQLGSLGYQYVASLYGNELATDRDPKVGRVVSYGFLCLSGSKELVACIRGTDTVEEWIHDFEFGRVPCPIRGGAGETEDGFTAIYLSLATAADSTAPTPLAAIQQQLLSGNADSLTIVGHSLGGALATLLTLDVALNTSCKNPVSYTFASPMVGDSTFAAAYDLAVPSTFRVVNRLDLVPRLPGNFLLRYEHVATGFELTPPWGKIHLSVLCMHRMTTYLWLMGQAANQDVGPLDPNCAA